MARKCNDSYVDLDYADAYFDARPHGALWSDLSDIDKCRALVSASDEFDALFRLKDSLNEKMRQGLTEIDDRVKRSVCTLVIIDAEGGGDEQRVKRVKVGSIEEEYIESVANNRDPYAYIRSTLGDLLNGGNHGFVKMVRS